MRTVAAERGWPPPSYNTIRSIVEGIDPVMAALAHHDQSHYRDRFELVYRRESKQPNAL